MCPRVARVRGRLRQTRGQIHEVGIRGALMWEYPRIPLRRVCDRRLRTTHEEVRSEAMLGIVDEEGEAKDLEWMEPVTENPAVGDAEVWEFYNTTGDAHPMHVHEIAFEVVNREMLALDGEELAEPLTPTGEVFSSEPWETGFKDTVIAYPAQITRVRAHFTHPGQFVWHCHIVEHEDNEMMRPFRIGPEQPGQPVSKGGADGEMDD